MADVGQPVSEPAAPGRLRRGIAERAAGHRASPAHPDRCGLAVRARVLACHGAQDPHVPLVDVTAFAGEMDAAGADWQLIMYGGAQHGFTHRRAVPGAIPGVAYDEPADTRSFEAIRAFLADAPAA